METEIEPYATRHRSIDTGQIINTAFDWTFPSFPPRNQSDESGEGISFDAIKKWREWEEKKKESFDVVKKMMKKRKGWEKKEEEEKGIYIYILRLPGYIDVTFLRRPRSPFFFFFIRHPISREQRDECASIPRRNSLRRRGAGSILGGRSLIRCWSYWT